MEAQESQDAIRHHQEAGHKFKLQVMYQDMSEKHQYFPLNLDHCLGPKSLASVAAAVILSWRQTYWNSTLSHWQLSVTEGITCKADYVILPSSLAYTYLFSDTNKNKNLDKTVQKELGGQMH